MRKCKHCRHVGSGRTITLGTYGAHCKSEKACFTRLAALCKLETERLNRLLKAGSPMAVACYNLSQSAVLSQAERDILARLDKDWVVARA